MTLIEGSATVSRELELNPEPGILVESLRDIGYSFQSALADIVDNSLAARATKIELFALPMQKSGFMVGIIDNGAGLRRNDLLRAMRLGSSNPRDTRVQGDLGRFGLGLKTASFSQCRRLTVLSRKDGQTSAFCWDLDEVVKNNQWNIIELTDISSLQWLEKLGESGTLVLWEKVDRIAGSRKLQSGNIERLVSEAQTHLSLTFHRFIEGSHGLRKVSIWFNGYQLQPLDPFNTGNPATQAGALEKIMQNVTLQSFTLPHASRYEDAAEYVKYGLPGGYQQNQGVYLYRANRLIIHGTWFGITKKLPQTQLCRVCLDIGIEEDESWKIDVKKTSAQLPDDVRERIKKLMVTIGSPSRRVYRRRTAALTSPDAYPIWRRYEKDGKVFYEIASEHPVIGEFRSSLDSEKRRCFDSVLSFIGTTFPLEALTYDLSNDADKVAMEDMSHEDFVDAARAFSERLMRKENMGADDVVAIMKVIPPFKSRWSEAALVLGVDE